MFTNLTLSLLPFFKNPSNEGEEFCHQIGL